jgi:dephospho-CoA kinase
MRCAWPGPGRTADPGPLTVPSLTVGLTGGIASGKSLATQAFVDLGVPVLDADLVAREVVAPGTRALAAIAREFGAGFIQADGSLDRRQLRERVFGDEPALRRLERITHPAIRARLIQWRDAQPAGYCILSVAILVEAGMRPLVDRVLVVDAPVESQVQRLLGRDGIAADLALRMIGAQATREQRLAAADDVIVNDGPPAALLAQVARLHDAYLAMARAGTPRAPGLRLP